MKNKVSIVGAGPIGSLLAIILKQKGFSVEIFEKRGKSINKVLTKGRSINLALSYRGIQALKLASIYEKIEPYLIPMYGRVMHDKYGKLTSQNYGKERQSIYSVSRNQLNKLLRESAEQAGVNIYFDHPCENIDFDHNTLFFKNGHQVKSDVIFGADGAFSTIRNKMQSTDMFNFSQHYIQYGYKEINMPKKGNDFPLEANYLHIWPRDDFMLIALPNKDKSFTCTLFFPYKGNPSYSTLNTKKKVTVFFENYFPDVIKLIPDLIEQFYTNPTSSLVTIKCDPWYKNQTILLGDAAHALVPFYGQGMNTGFEDIRLFIEMAEQMNWEWDKVLPKYFSTRKKDTDAISELALCNFIEMRNHVGDSNFLKRKKLEAQIQEKYPKDWIPLYSMVAFSNIPYSEALRLGRIQKNLIDNLPINSNSIDFHQLITQFKNLKIAD